MHQRDTITDVGRVTGNNSNRGGDEIMEGVKLKGETTHKYSLHYVTKGNVLPPYEVRTDLLQSEEQQSELQSAFTSNQYVGICNKNLYANQKYSSIMSESQCCNDKTNHSNNHVNTNNTNSTSNTGPMGPGTKVLQHNRGIGVRNVNVGNEYKVDFTNWQFIDQQTGNPTYIVAIHNFESKGVKFYYFHLDNDTNATLYTCHKVPEGTLQIIDSHWWCIERKQHHSHVLLDNANVSDVDPKVAHDNYLKDAVVQKYFKLSYVRYMECIIDYLIAKQSGVDGIKVNESNDVCTKTNTLLTSVDNTSENSTQWLGGGLVSHTKLGIGAKDKYFPSKSHGHITLSDDNFTFIGPDRAVCDITDSNQYLRIAETIRQTGLPNYRGARIPIKSGLNLEAWERHLSDYPNRKLMQYLKFGFPLSIQTPDKLTNIDVKNHFTALQHPKEVATYLQQEMSFGAILGPFDKPPCEHIHCSPLLTRPKDGNKRRVILNLSYPYGGSVNDQVDKQHFDGSEFILRFPTIDDIVAEINKLGDDVVLAKIDVSRAFRNLRVDPADTVKFGIKWEGKYFLDQAVAFGWVHGTSAFQMLSDAVTYLMAKRHHNIFAYIDDYVIVATRDTANAVFHDLLTLLLELGLPINETKLTPPSRTVTCLGISVNLDTNSLSIDNMKLQEIHLTSKNFVNKRYTSKKQLQSLIGKLIYIHKCVAPARVFINRMLNLLRESGKSSKIKLTQDFFQDLAWFLAFLPKFNGVTYIKKDPIPFDHTLHVDASLTGLGGIWNNRVYATPVIPLVHFHLKIVHLEMLNILVALRKWHKFWAHSKVQIFCDNLAVVLVTASGKTKDPYLAACLRNLWLITATCDIDLEVNHIPGTHNNWADFLSRLHGKGYTDPELLSYLEDNYHWEKIGITDLTLDLSI